MAFKMVALFATLACASAGYLEADHHSAHYSPASAVSYSSITREHHPTKVAKTVTYAEPDVHYAAPVTKTLSYAEPAVHYAAPITKTLAYAQPAMHYAQPSVQYVHEPTYTKTVVAEPAYTKTYEHQQPNMYTAKTLTYQAPVTYSSLAVKSVVPVAKTYVSEPIYAKTYASEPIYAKTYASEPVYAKTYASEPVYTKTVVQQPTYVKTAQPLYAHSAPVVATKTQSYAPEAQVSHISYQDANAHYAW
ncbi:larval/pupal cuticle protein H1C-like [Ochlerotatus camptorhynchus]|uniref:larval/pupal cuticle protein H1C-like n=1 Tax=Ochlerotatus camptorhynchus TaxID=644619 RepID=UPI0031E07901